MANQTETIDTLEDSEVSSQKCGDSSHMRPPDFPTVPLFDRLLSFVKPVVEYSFEMYMGAVIGHLVGWYSGNAYVDHFEPVYLYDIEHLKQWESLPRDFAVYGAIIGVVLGAIMIAIINSKLLCQRVASLYEKGVIDPEDIGRALGKSGRQIQRAIKKLAKKRRIVCKKVNVPERLPIRLANTY